MRSIGVPLVVSAILPSAAIAVAPCPAGMTLMAEAVPWRGDTFTVCETAEPGGALHFLPGSSATTSRANAGGAPIVVSRTAKPLFNTTPTYANTSAAAVGNSSADVMGNALLARGVDPTLSELANVMRPLVLVGGYDFNDPIQCTTHGEPTGCKAYAFDGGVHTFIGSRGSSADIVFDTLGSDVMSEGHPSMNGFIHKYGLSNAIFKDKLDPMVVLEGLWGGYLPIISYWYKREAGGWIEYTAAPVADMQGSMEQDAYFRVQRIAENGTVLRSQYYENYAYTAGAFQDPEQVPASGGCATIWLAARALLALMHHSRRVDADAQPILDSTATRGQSTHAPVVHY